MPAPDPEPQTSATSAAAAYREFQARIANGECVNFEEFCAARPDLADDLRARHQSVTVAGVDAAPTIVPDVSKWLTEQSGVDADTPRYNLEGEIARGGMGVILKVWDGQLRRRLAMKVILSEDGKPATEESSAVSRPALNRFLEEAQVTGQLDHPGVVPVHEIGVDDGGQVYFTMRLVKGMDFGAVIEAARTEVDGWTMTRALNALHKVCETMAYAHSKGVVHRDLKPANIMVGRFGETYVMDWGLAKVVVMEPNAEPVSMVDVTPHVDPELANQASSDPDAAHFTQQGSVLGTPCYMPPEQARGELQAIGPHSDVYSTGAMMYQLLTGERPYATRGVLPRVQEVLLKVVRGESPTPIRKIEPKVASELIAICEKAMAVDIADRYPEMTGMANDLRAFLEGRVVHAYEAGAIAEFKKYVARNKATAIATGALLVVAIASSVGFAIQQKGEADAIAREQQNTQQARDDALENLEIARRSSYAANLIAANVSLRDNEVAEAKRHLRGCLPEYRGWEWHHLALRSDMSIRTLTGHAAGVRSVASDLAGQIIATGGHDGVVRLWDAASGELSREIPAHRDSVVSLAIRPDRNSLWSVGGWNDHIMRSWSLETGELQSQLSIEVHGDSTLCLSPDGARAAFASPEHTIVIIDSSNGHEEQRLRGHVETVCSLAFDPAGDRLVSGSQDGTVRLWNSRTGAASFVFEPAVGPIHSVAFHPAGLEIAAGTEFGLIRRWDPASGELVGSDLEGHGGVVFGLAYGASGSRLASASADKTVRIWSVESGALAATLSGHDRAARSVAFLGEGTRVISGSDDATARIWPSRAVGVVAIERDSVEEFQAVATSTDGRSVAIGSGYPAVIELHALDDSRPPRTIAEFGDEVITALAMTADDQTVVAAFEESARLRVYAVSASTEPVALLGHDASVTCVAVSPDGSLAVSGSDDETVRLWNLTTGECSRVWVGHTNAVTSIAVFPDGKRVASASLDGTLRFWSLESREAIGSVWHRPEFEILAIAISPDGSNVAIGAADGTLRIFDVASAVESRVLRGHAESVTTVGYSPDGTRLVTGSRDQTLRIWDARPRDSVESSRSLLTLRGHAAPITSVAFSGDGTRIVSVSEDAVGRVWEAR